MEPNQQRLAVVLTGAVARGAFQAGALSRVLAGIEEQQGLRPSILIGTSAGAINTVLWANRAEKPAVTAGREIEGVWAGMNGSDAYARIFSLSTAARDLLPAVAGLVGVGPGIYSLLDTTPLARTLEDHLRPVEFADAGPLDTVGVVATWVPPATTAGSAGGRSVLFLQERTPTQWPGDDRRALDVERCPIAVPHVLASSAVPGGFPAQKLTAAHVSDRRKIGWYVDGGVRLNCALQPAIRLGATHIVLISAMSLQYPDFGDHAARRHRPAIDDAASQVVHALLADRAVEDLVHLGRINRMLRITGQEQIETDEPGHPPYRTVQVMAISPKPGQLGALADEAWQERYSGVLHAAGLEDNAWLGHALRSAGDGPGRRDLLSYVLFDEHYFGASIRHGRKMAEEALARGWQTDPLAQGSVGLQPE